jgi:hypothetical protein
LQAANSAKRETGELEHKPEVVEAWVSQLCQRFGHGPIAVSVEQVKGALVYILGVVRSQQTEGYEPVKSTSSRKLSGVVFARQDFKKDVVYESVLVKACDAHALVFIFGGADQETVNKLSEATELTLDPATSGCSSTAASPVQK